MNFSFSLVLYSLVISASVFASDSLDNYPAVCDYRNYKPPAGGKELKPQGRPLAEKSDHLLFGESSLCSLGVINAANPWRYMVTMNCKNGSTNLVALVTKLATQLLPSNQRDRLAILILTISDLQILYQHDLYSYLN